jgi:hypothetical protein
MTNPRLFAWRGIGGGLERAVRGAGRAKTLPVVWVLSTGGTISGRGATSTSLAEYKSGAILGEDLVRSVPEIAQVATVKVEQIANVSSTAITTAHWLTLANRINAIFAAEPQTAGVVITHGTNTLEETAYFLNLTVKDERPVVLVGSMRPASAISADGPLNLLNAVRTAVSQEARGKGVLVVLNDEINAARDVTKTNTVSGRDVPGARARPARLRRRGPGELLPRADPAAHRRVRVRRSRPHVVAEGGHCLFVRRSQPGRGSGAGRQRRRRHRVRRHLEPEGCPAPSARQSPRSRRCRPRRGRSSSVRAAPATAG